MKKQVCKRIERRIKTLGLSGLRSYKEYLEDQQNEWVQLDGMCRITISRFYRDKGVFGHLREDLLPELAERLRSGGERILRIWSAGCASGEEPYTLSIIWQRELAAKFPELIVEIVATDSHPDMLTRAEKGCYRYSSLKELPKPWLESVFIVEDSRYCLKEKYRKSVTVLRQDIRSEMPDGQFDVILCRNLVFSYFDETLQRKLLERIWARLRTGGFLVTGTHESLPEGAQGFEPRGSRPGLYRKVG